MKHKIKCDYFSRNKFINTLKNLDMLIKIISDNDLLRYFFSVIFYLV